jgi:hypothetical protein
MLILFLRLVPVLSPQEHSVCSLGKVLFLVLVLVLRLVPVLSPFCPFSWKGFGSRAG